MAKHRLLFASTSVGPLGSGLGGGVELTLKNIATELLQRGHHVQVVAPSGSCLEGVPVVQVSGALQETAQSQGRDAAIVMPAEPVIAAMWDYIRSVQLDYDLILNFAYDWLPFYLTPFLQRPIGHLVSMGSLSEAMDRVIGQIASLFPGTIAVHSRTQAATFPFAQQCRCLGNGIDLSLYDFCAHPQSYLAWVGRIAPEKALEDALAASEHVGIPLKIMGAIADPEYWQQLCQTYPSAIAAYQGFLSTAALQQQLRQARALLVTPRWVEAFGNVVIESLACGVPVIAYRRGGPAEIIQEGKTGWLVEPDNVAGLVEAILHIDDLDRRACRRQAEQEFSQQAMGDRVEQWICDMLSSYQQPKVLHDAVT
ncbi:MAG: glycosyltransferase family 4 protein [Cyanobacteria bacterium]|nr:glycosyltransferase family 4 protein [Cyanobacteriota bacterium]MDW8201126.1 glycosyltransferase family 4 protein [Cyanobacteriota bacterium SKYGB_h_bin112]